jgi:hypothetical protein
VTKKQMALRFVSSAVYVMPVAAKPSLTQRETDVDAA